MYRRELSPFNSAGMGQKRDVLGRLREASQNRNSRSSALSHRTEQDWFMDGRAVSRRGGAEREEPLSDFHGPSVNVTGENTRPSLIKTAEGIAPSREGLEDRLLSSARSSTATSRRCSTLISGRQTNPSAIYENLKQRKSPAESSRLWALFRRRLSIKKRLFTSLCMTASFRQILNSISRFI